MDNNEVKNSLLSYWTTLNENDLERIKLKRVCYHFEQP